MNKFLIILVVFLLGCTSSGDEKSNLGNTSTNEELKRQARLLDGFWLANGMLENVKKSKSIYLNRKYSTKVYGFVLEEENLVGDSAYLGGFTEHEGGYETPLVFDTKINKFVNHLARLSEYPSFPEAFELEIKSDSLLAMNFDGHSDIYRKVADDQIAFREVLFEGSYKDGQGGEVKLLRDGTAAGFKDAKYYDVITDFGEGIFYDAITFYKEKREYNLLEEGEMYTFRFDRDTLILNHIETNWEDLNHRIDSIPVKLIKKNGI